MSDAGRLSACSAGAGHGGTLGRLRALCGGGWPTLPLAAGVVCLLIPLVTSDAYTLRQMSLIAVLALVVSGVNLSFGYAGEVHFGQVFVFAFGAYASMALATRGLDEIVPLVLIGGVLSAAAAALMALPAVRIGGWALAVTSFSLVTLIAPLATVLSKYTGGAAGLYLIPTPKLAGSRLSNVGLYEVVICVTALWFAFFRNFVTSRYRVIIRTLRESPTVARSLGFPVLRVRLQVWSLGAFPAGMAGCLFGYVSFFISPDAFGFNLAVGLIAASVLGGVESVYGAVLGAIVLQLGPEESNSFSNYAPIAYGAFLVVAAVLLPRGVSGLVTQNGSRLARRWLPGAKRRGCGADLLAADRHRALNRAVRLNDGDALPSLDGGMLSVTGISKQFGGNHALSDVSLMAKRGSVTGLIGSNGSGKTTLLNIISGFVSVDAGTVTLGSDDLTGMPAHRRAVRGIGRTFQTPAIPAGETVLDVVASGRFQRDPRGIAASTFRSPGYRRACAADRAHALAILDRVGLLDRAGDMALTLPLGSRRLLEIARALCGSPGVLLLDEPASGLSDEEVERLGHVIVGAGKAGATVVLVEHNFAFISRICDVVHVLHLGSVIASGSVTAVARDEKVISSYLGESDRADGTSVEAANASASAAVDTDAIDAPASVPDRRRERLGAGPNATSESKQPTLAVDALDAGYGDARILTGVSLRLHPGAIEVMLGPNGAGKTTLLNVIAGQLGPWSGTVRLEGVELGGDPPHARAAAGIALVQEGKRIFRQRTVIENVALGTISLRLSRLEREAWCKEVLAQFPALQRRPRERAGGLSGGQQQMLALAQALASRPKVLLLDEPSAGLAPAITREVFLRLRALRAQGLAVLLVEQLADAALAVADHVTVIDNGRIVSSGAPENYIDRSKLEVAYFAR